MGSYRQIVKTPKIEFCEMIRNAQKEGPFNNLVRIMVSSAKGNIKPCPIPKGPWRIHNYSESQADFSLFSIPNGDYQGKLEFSKDDDDNVGTVIATSTYKKIVNRKKKKN